jgi:hypothetical protein
VHQTPSGKHQFPWRMAPSTPGRSLDVILECRRDHCPCHATILSTPACPLVYINHRRAVERYCAAAHRVRSSNFSVTDRSLVAMSQQVLACLALSNVLFNQALGQPGINYGPMSTRQNQIVFPPADGPCPQNIGQIPCKLVATDFLEVHIMLNYSRLLLCGKLCGYSGSRALQHTNSARLPALWLLY